MPEVELTGMNGLTYPVMATWHWEVALYLFLGGLVAGLMVFGSGLRLLRTRGFDRVFLVVDLAGLPLILLGLFLLWLDLENRWNFWRLFTTFQIPSPMSWGSWILLLVSGVLGLRLLTRVPVPDRTRPRGRVAQIMAWVQGLLAGIGRWSWIRARWFEAASLLLGVGLGFYTGVLLSSISARPLWNSGVLAPLFLVSGLATGGAFLCLFLTHEQHVRLVPLNMLLCGVELLLLLTYILGLIYGTDASQRAAAILLGGTMGLVFWWVLVAGGLLLPVALEGLDAKGRRLPGLLQHVPPMLKLTGGIALRFVVLYAGLQSFV